MVGTGMEAAGYTPDIWKITSAEGGPKDAIKEFGQFKWSGRNSHAARVTGGKNLAAYIEKVKKKYPKERINVIAHSHGGNVAQESTWYLGSTTIDTMVLMATPQVRIRYDSVWTSPWYDWIYRPKAGKVKNKILNLWNEADSVQAYWSDVRDNISKSDTSDPHYYEGVEVYKQVFDDPRAQMYDSQEAAKTEITFNGIWGHGIYFRDYFGTAIGYYIGSSVEKRDWAKASEVAKIPKIVKKNE